MWMDDHLPRVLTASRRIIPAMTVVLLLLVPLARGGWRARWRAMSAPPSDIAGLPAEVGDPLPGAGDVRLVRALLRLVPTDVTVDVRVDSAAFSADRMRYLRYQLLHLEYPRVVPVVPSPPDDRELTTWHIIGPGVRPPDTARLVAGAGAYRLVRGNR